MLKRLWVRCAVGAALVLLAGAAAVAPFSQAEPTTREKCAQIRPGMAMAEVVALLRPGAGQGGFGGGGCTPYLFSFPDGTIEVLADPWEDRVHEVRFVPAPATSLRNRLRAWLGW
jgi:hypothetical protein